MAKKNDISQAEMPAGENRETIYDASMRLRKEAEEKEVKKILIPIEHLHPYPDHPYKVQDDESMDALVESIKERGVMSPISVRPWENAPYEYDIISGHRRVHAAQKAGLLSVPAFVYTVSRDEAAIMVVDSNLHRDRILPSEKARAYKCGTTQKSAQQDVLRKMRLRMRRIFARMKKWLSSLEKAEHRFSVTCV